MRRILMVVLGLGVIFGFGSGIASLRYRMHHGSCHSDWRQGRRDYGAGDWRRAEPQVRAPAPTPQTVVVQQPAATPAPASAPQVFVILPQGASPAPQVITVPIATPLTAQPLAAPVPAAQPSAAPAPSGNVAPAADAP